MEFQTNLDASLRELKRVRTITTCAMMAAMAVVVSFYSLKIGAYINIGLGTMVNQIVAAMFGGAVGAIFNAVVDVIKYFVKPDGAFMLSFTLNSALAGLIYGISYYKHPLTLRRIFITQLIVSIICNLLITTYLLQWTTGKAFLVMLPLRVVKNAVMLPINTALFYSISQSVLAIRSRVLMQGH